LVQGRDRDNYLSYIPAFLRLTRAGRRQLTPWKRLMDRKAVEIEKPGQSHMHSGPEFATGMAPILQGTIQGTLPRLFVSRLNGLQRASDFVGGIVGVDSAPEI
jgi:hypothetical protein